jgi:hypothetical protein
MSVFEHLMTLGSFVLALGIGTLLSGVSTLVHRRGETKLSVPHMLWAASILLAHVNFWLGSFNRQGIDQASAYVIIHTVLYPTLLYLQSALIAPESGGSMNMPIHHERNRVFYCSLAIACATMQIFYALVVGLASPVPGLTERFIFVQVMFVVFGLAGALVKPVWAQTAAAGGHFGFQLLSFSNVMNVLSRGT